uniref:Uncharacterized protein n=1 Tax=Graphocephala atropunctata TaxID=36148 RepID=A0A1B6KXA7_9HEMI
MYRILVLVPVVVAYQQVSFYRNITLEDLDNRLVKMINHPQKDKGDDLMDGSFWYYSQLEDMEKAFLAKELDSLNVIKRYVEKGKPNFAKTKLNKTAIRSQFLWDKGDFLEFGVNVEGTLWIWDKFMDILNATSS